MAVKKNELTLDELNNIAGGRKFYEEELTKIKQQEIFHDDCNKNTFDIEDILDEYKDITFEKSENIDLEYLKKNEYKEMYSILSWKPQHINTIAKKLQSNISEISYKLMMMELDEYIEQLPGNFYIRK